eukprot:TRINITY_DN21364_c0_g1_i1.p1 TRINITY_DN21364_c0_g1~~TRINITY_DN21364_c0_g1_i1.p1  ORF type:complete len:599 (+),score=114.50 TRINITY_DN21364_c0_g1_i1:122-1918(+)
MTAPAACSKQGSWSNLAIRDSFLSFQSVLISELEHMQQEINRNQALSTDTVRLHVSQEALNVMVNDAIREVTVSGLGQPSLKEGSLEMLAGDADMLPASAQTEDEVVVTELKECKELNLRSVKPVEDQVKSKIAEATEAATAPADEDEVVVTERPECNKRNNRKSRKSVEDQMKEKLAEATEAIQASQERTPFLQLALKLTGRKGKGKDNQRQSEGGHWVNSPAFDLFTAFMIVLNSVLMGIEVEVLSNRYESVLAIDLAGLGFSIFFLIELMLRLAVFRIKFFTNEERSWNVFDLLLVLGSVFDSVLLFQGGDAQVAVGGLKTLKMLRVARLFRVFRFFRQLSSLALMVIDSMASLFWALLMFSLIVYVFAITISNLTVDWLKQQSSGRGTGWQQSLAALNSDAHNRVITNYGNLSKTIYTLFQATLNGEDWAYLVAPLWDVDWFAASLMILYVLFTMIAMLNIFTGVFVDNALQNARKQREVQIEEQLDKQRVWLEQVREFFEAADVDKDGGIDLDEMQALLEDPVMTAYLSLIGFQFDDAKKIFRLFDKDGSGQISFGEFMRGCESLKGPARKVDVHLLMSDVNSLMEKSGRSRY